MNLIGRIEEQQILASRLASADPELIAVYGRRRVGKTYLIRTFCKDHIIFEFTGIHESGMKTQLENFSQALQQATKSAVALAIPGNWLQAFAMLDVYIPPINLLSFSWMSSLGSIRTSRVFCRLLVTGGIHRQLKKIISK